MEPFGREITGMLEIHLSYVGRVLGKRNQEKLEQRFGEKVQGETMTPLELFEHSFQSTKRGIEGISKEISCCSEDEAKAFLNSLQLDPDNKFSPFLTELLVAYCRDIDRIRNALAYVNSEKYDTKFYFEAFSREMTFGGLLEILSMHLIHHIGQAVRLHAILENLGE